MVNPLYKFWLVIRSTFFWALFLPGVTVTSILVSISYFLPIKFRIGILKCWIEITLFSLAFFCGLRFQIEGEENITSEGVIIMSKHSSTWETIAIQKFFGPLVWVVKKELIWIPFFGWALASLDAIALNRGTGRQAVNQLIRESKSRMDEGRTLMLFPEGTRVLPMQKKPFKVGGAIVSKRTGYSILPIAHNAGEFWPRHSWIKWPGMIRIVIGKPISPEGKSSEQIIGEVGDWISGECERISDKEQLRRLGLSK
jgi:1-acyl-sn-glycerol-3-phosphate acyltransferase